MNDIEVLENIKSMIIYDSDDDYENQVAIREIMALENAIKSLKEKQSDRERIKDLEEINEAHKKENGDLRERVKELEKENKRLNELDVSNNKLIANMSERHFHDREKIRNSIPKSLIKEKIEEIKKYRDIAKELIEERVVIADSDSLNYGRAEAHDKDIQVLEELLNGKM